MGAYLGHAKGLRPPIVNGAQVGLALLRMVISPAGFERHLLNFD
jgi:hypothetical protein